MCGIAAVVGGIPEPSRCDAVLDGMAHRGPDDRESFSDDGIWLGHTRLSIVDLTDAGRQPMQSPDGRFVLSYNGEIYNHRELRRDLEASGWPLRGSGDTEVLLGLLATEGRSCLPRLRGMFAFVLWDREQRSVLAARDPLGIKPLLFAEADGRLVLASEVRTMTTLGVAHRIDPLSVEDFLLTGSTRAPRTIFAGVSALRPGHLIDYRDGRLTVSPWWQPVSAPADADEREVPAELDRLLGESVRRQLRSDVPVGSFLSGGLDSSLVTSYAAEGLAEPLRTFSVGFGDASAAWDESAAAALVAERYATRHSRIEIGRADFERQIEELPRAVDQPSVDGVNSYFICKAAAASVTVCLSGQGGDELFGGYNIFRFAARLQGALDRLPAPPRVAARVGHALRRLPARVQHNWYARGIAGALSGGHPDLLAEIANPLFGPGEIGTAHTAARANADRDLVNEISLRLLRGYLPDTLLRDMDAMSMAHSLEVRVPIVDHELAEFALSIPGSEKVAWEESKRPLRRIAEARLPAAILERPKQGFAFPLAEWLRHPSCLGPVKECLAPAVVRDAALVEPQLVQRELRRFEQPRRGDLAWLRAHRVWALYVLHRWHQHWRDGTL